MAFRLGFVGIGSIARHHAAAAQSLGAKVVAAVSRRPDSPNRSEFAIAAPDCRFVDSLAALIAQDDIDGYVVCAPWDAVAEVATALISTGKPLLLEKPVALDLRSTQALADAAGTRRDIAVGFNRRFFASVQALKSAVDRQTPIGASLRVCETVHRQRDRQGAKVVPNLLAFSGSHFLDTLLHVLGPTEIEAMAAYRHSGALSPFVSYSGMLRSKGGVPVLLEISAETPGPSELRVRFADEQCWVLSPMESAAVYRGSVVRESDSSGSVRQYVPNLVDRVDADRSQKPGIREQMANFLGGVSAPAATLHDAVNVMALIDALRETPATGES